MAEYDMLNILKDAQYGEQDDRMRDGERIQNIALKLGLHNLEDG